MFFSPDRTGRSGERVEDRRGSDEEGSERSVQPGGRTSSRAEPVRPDGSSWEVPGRKDEGDASPAGRGGGSSHAGRKEGDPEDGATHPRAGTGAGERTTSTQRDDQVDAEAGSTSEGTGRPGRRGQVDTREAARDHREDASEVEELQKAHR